MLLKNALSQLINIFLKLTLSQKISFLALTGITITGLSFSIFWATQPNYQTLFSGLNPEDAGSVIDHLGKNKIPYRISENGNSILIPREKIYETRMSLASKGLPQGGNIGFEIFDNTKIGMSEFSQNINYQRALQGELSRTINGFDEIESSRVHIVMPSKSVFSEKEDPASASVIVRLHPGRHLDQNKVQAIIHLLSSSISDLDPSNVTVVDNNGTMLTKNKMNDNLQNVTETNLEYQDKIEKNLENRIKSILETALGSAKSSVKVSCLLDLKKQEKTEELYYPENRVIRSEQHFDEISNQNEKTSDGIPGASNNKTPAESQINKSPKGYQKKDQTINYEIGKVVSHIIEPVGEIRKLSVAVIVDGTYRENKDEDGKTMLQYIPRPDDELEKLKNIVKRSVNFDSKRGDEIDLVNLPFEITKFENGLEDEHSKGLWTQIIESAYYFRYIAVVIFMILAFIFIVRPIVSWITTSVPRGSSMIEQLSRTPHNNINNSNAPARQLSYHDEASKLIKSDHTSIDLLKQWMNEAQ